MQKKLRTSAKIIITSVIVGIVGAMTTIVLLASSSRSIKVQNFIGLTKKQVQTWVSDNEVNDSLISYTYEYDEERDKDLVIAQSLSAGEVLSDDTVLEITLSNGADPEKEFALIDFTGKHEDEIKAWFEENKFTSVSYVYEYHPDQEDKLFVSCEPSIGATVKRGDAIKVVISVTEPQEVTVPDLSSYSKENIDAWASENQITIDYQEEYSDTVESGKVISVSVETGSTIKQGDTITIVISKGQEVEETAATTRSYSTYTGEVSGNSASESTTVSNEETVTEEVQTVTCTEINSIIAAAYNNSTASVTQSDLQSIAGCPVYMTVNDTQDTNPGNTNGIQSMSNNGSYYSVVFNQKW